MSILVDLGRIVLVVAAIVSGLAPRCSPGKIQFSHDRYEVAEGETARITVLLSKASEDAVVVSYTTLRGTAVAGIDYKTSTGTLKFAKGETKGEFLVETIDNRDASKRRLVLRLSQPTAGWGIVTDEVDLLISDNDRSAQQRTFAGIRFGVGISLTSDLGDNDRISSAVIETVMIADQDGNTSPTAIVRVTEDQNRRARVMLETHYFFQPRRRIRECWEVNGEKNRKGARGSKKCLDAKSEVSTGVRQGRRRNWGIGPFLAIQPGTDEIVESIGIGVMVGLRRGGDDSEGNQSFNLGLGVVNDPSVQILGEGFVADQPAPLDENSNPLPIRFRKTDQTGLLLLASFSF